MSLFSGPEEHADNVPATWQVVKRGRGWSLQTKAGVQLDSYATKREAEAARLDGMAARLYAREARWYAGETVHPWRPYAEVRAEQERNAARYGARR